MSDWSIEIDLSQLEEAVAEVQNPKIELLSQAIKDAAEYVRQTWGQAVQGLQLPGMVRSVVNDEYYESLQTGDALKMISPLHGAVISTYAGVERIESGYPSFDMKPGLLASSSAREGKHGRYLFVPFRHMTPQGKQASAGARPHGATMPTFVYKIVKKSGAFQDPSDARRGAQIGQRSKLAASVNLEALARGKPAPMGDNYTWKFGLYHGMRQIKKTYDKVTQSTYMTWRAVSEASDPQSWIHPGQGANPLISAVINATEEQVAQMVMAGARAAFGLPT